MNLSKLGITSMKTKGIEQVTKFLQSGVKGAVFKLNTAMILYRFSSERLSKIHFPTQNLLNAENQNVEGLAQQTSNKNYLIIARKN